MNTEEFEMEGNTSNLKMLTSLEESILLTVGDSTIYGWSILKRINEVYKDVRTFSYGSLYPTLHKLEKMGLLTSEWGDNQKDQESKNGMRKRYYRITEDGIRVLENMENYRLALKLGSVAFGHA
jgi:PadR family transcriptional regulator PadR